MLFDMSPDDWAVLANVAVWCAFALVMAVETMRKA